MGAATAGDGESRRAAKNCNFVIGEQQSGCANRLSVESCHAVSLPALIWTC
jgi:hypothetical protein